MIDFFVQKFLEKNFNQTTEKAVILQTGIPIFDLKGIRSRKAVILQTGIPIFDLKGMRKR